jgi:hypothetical protein
MPRLHTAVLRVHNARRGRFAVSAEEAAAIMQSSSALRRLAVNDTKWEVCTLYKLLVKSRFLNVHPFF